MTVRLYSSFDTGAPALTAASGSVIDILNACLVDGYGTKAAAGWTRAYTSSTTGADYKQGSGSNGLVFHVDDSGGPLCRVAGFEAVTAYGVGAARFPTESQSAGGLWMIKHDGGAGNRQWFVVASERLLYFWTQFNTSADCGQGALFFFGDIAAGRAGDGFATIIAGASRAPYSGNYPGDFNTQDGAHFPCCYTVCGAFLSVLNPTFGHYLARGYSQLGGSVLATKQSDISKLWDWNNRYLLQLYNYYPTAGMWPFSQGDSGLTFPNPADGAFLMSAVTVCDGRSQRGVLPALWAPLHGGGGPLYHGYRFFGTGALAGKEFLLLNCGLSQAALEISDTW